MAAPWSGILSVSLAAIVCVASARAQQVAPRPGKTVEVFVIVRKPGKWVPRADGAADPEAPRSREGRSAEGRRLEGRDVRYRFEDQTYDDLEQLQRALRKCRNDAANWTSLSNGTVGPPAIVIRGDLQMRVRDIVDVVDLALRCRYVFVEPEEFDGAKFWLASGRPGRHRSVVLPPAGLSRPIRAASSDLVYALADNRYESREGLVANLVEDDGRTKVIHHFRDLFEELAIDGRVLEVQTGQGVVEAVKDPLVLHADQWCYWGSVATVMRIARQKGFRNLALATASTDGDAREKVGKATGDDGGR